MGSKNEVNDTIKDNTHFVDIASTSDYKWPGIEAVMEAYDTYSCERKQEKDFLFERSNELKNKLQDINNKAEHLGQQMANLLQTKSNLDEERQRYESTLETLKTCIRQLR
ncbi:unnamed protein product [Medioppia subpectinata]|uniref:Uncharacterized protein n=1 Tax=Medioppia subpectinata TaxID=1979941 RepID=A0A7R9LYT3_9ACAR|nr:unnamed protein product [Medioppia subpectinata]CAG2122813.1 unnamed protein product [Medioppia subpectinata]